jgi:hypothetical protein
MYNDLLYRVLKLKNNNFSVIADQGAIADSQILNSEIPDANYALEVHKTSYTLNIYQITLHNNYSDDRIDFFQRSRT